MVHSLNTKVDFTIKGVSYLGLSSYGEIMIGDIAFEFYNNQNKKDYIQIPWSEVDYIVASVLFKGKKIPRFALITKKNGKFTFSSRNNKALLRAVNHYVDTNKMVRSLSFFDVIKRGVKRLIHI
ncbi:MAG: DUF956 family protein [Breznakia sp.]